MAKPIFTAALLALALSASGCTSFEKMTGLGRDNTVLPGTREAAIPGKAVFPDPSDTVGTISGQPDAQAGAQQPAQTATTAPTGADQATAAPKPPCKASDSKCKQASGDIFSDPQ